MLCLSLRAVLRNESWIFCCAGLASICRSPFFYFGCLRHGYGGGGGGKGPQPFFLSAACFTIRRPTRLFNFRDQEKCRNNLAGTCLHTVVEKSAGPAAVRPCRPRGSLCCRKFS